MIARLQEAGLRVTPQRLAIWQALQETAGQHPTAADLYEHLQEAYPTLGLATIYNTLELFGSLGLVRSLAFEGRVRYDVDTANHVNLICLSCGHIDDLAPSEEVPLDELTAAVERASGYRISHPRLDYYGLCRNCQEKQHG